MALETWILFVATAFVLSAIPGPIMILALTNGAQVGVRRTVCGILGTSSGNLLLMALSSVGLGALLYSSALAFALVKWLGAAYLIYLGIQLWRAPAVGIEAPIAAAGAVRSKRGLFLQSFFVAVSNPKGLIFFGALFPQFIQPGVSQGAQFAILSLTFLAIDCVWQLVYSVGGNRIVGWLKTPRQGRWFNRANGGVLIGTGLLLSTMRK